MQRHKLFFSATLALVIFGMISCGNNKTKEMVTTQSFGSFDGKDVSLYTLTNKKGDVLKLSNYGAVIVEIIVPDLSLIHISEPTRPY